MRRTARVNGETQQAHFKAVAGRARRRASTNFGVGFGGVRGVVHDAERVVAAQADGAPKNAKKNITNGSSRFRAATNPFT